MAGLTIDQFDLSVFNMYAVRTMMNEQVNQQWRLHEAATIPPQLQVFNAYPKLSELDLLLGIIPLHTPWAYFYPPKRLRNLRRSPFSFYRAAPSFGSVLRHDEEMEMLESIACNTAEERQEQAALLGCLKQLGKINSWKAFIVGRIGQFLQG
jgi:hypothetical protein